MKDVADLLVLLQHVPVLTADMELPETSYMNRNCTPVTPFKYLENVTLYVKILRIGKQPLLVL